MTKPGAGPKTVNLALQGGGAHGAFTWGVLDRILEDGRLKVDAISGTSAGAMNAVVIADGFTRGGADGARLALHEFWLAVSKAARASPIQRSPIDVFMGNWSLDFSPGVIWLDLMSRLVSPYEFNPLNLNPLKDLIESQVDFDHVHHCGDVRLFVSATNVHTGRVRVFTNEEISADTVMASACLPYIFQAVEIDGVPYWDGGYIGNPVLYPFFYETDTADIVLVQVNPIERRETPTSARDILNRMNEITFNS
ncbi:MAG: patatin-like phospholipase family protein, partial [Hyphomicrobiales bacterium]